MEVGVYRTSLRATIWTGYELNVENVLSSTPIHFELFCPPLRSS